MTPTDFFSVTPLLPAILPLFSLTNPLQQTRPVIYEVFFTSGKDTTSQWKSSWNRSPTWRPFLFTKWGEFSFANRAPVDYCKPWKRKGTKTTFEYRSAVRDASTSRWHVILQRFPRRTTSRRVVKWRKEKTVCTLLLLFTYDSIELIIFLNIVCDGIFSVRNV